MSRHSYSRVWVHLIWATLERRPLLSKPAAVKLSGYLSSYSAEKGVYMKINYVNAEHVHRRKTFAEEFKLFVKRYELQWHDD
jgi:REP element-mobilizing transposase RayT